MSNMWFANKNIIVTSGGTQEYIDDVRVMTNISTGALGAIVAEHLYDKGAVVHYLHGITAKSPDLLGENGGARVYPRPFKSCADLLGKMEELITMSKIDAVVHCAAVSDFTFKREGHIKVRSDSEADFIEYMRNTIVRTPKIIEKIKVWSPQTIVIGFKFTVGNTFDQMLETAKTMAKKNGCEAVFANDKVAMNDSGSHVGVFVDMIDDSCTSCNGKFDIANRIAGFLSMMFANPSYRTSNFEQVQSRIKTYEQYCTKPKK